jgi:hypothetical protein
LAHSGLNAKNVSITILSKVLIFQSLILLGGDALYFSRPWYAKKSGHGEEWDKEIFVAIYLTFERKSTHLQAQNIKS